MSRTRNARSGMHGMSLVELMVGVAVGLFIVAAAALLTSSQLQDNRQLLLETQVQQDLRATMDLVVRDLRRSGAWDNAYRQIPAPTGATPPTVEPSPIDYVILPTSSTAAPLYYNYDRKAGMASYGFKLVDGVLKGCVGALTNAGCDEGWQDISDSSTVYITDFHVANVRAAPRAHADNKVPQRMICPNLCDPDPTSALATACWPTVTMRELIVSIGGYSKSQPTIARTINGSVRIRNHKLTLGAGIPSGQACPANP